jgi:hypothetical protein
VNETVCLGFARDLLVPFVLLIRWSCFQEVSMRRFTVRETSPGINHFEPGKLIYWHWSVEAHSAAAAEAAIRQANTGGRDQVVVQPLS